MTSPDRESLERELALAEESVRRTRSANSQLAQQFREEPTEELRELLKRAAESLATARDQAERAAAVLALFERTGSLFGVVPRDGAVTGTIALRLEPGISRAERTKRIADALAQDLAQAADELGATLAAAPERYTRERPGRDEEGRTLLDVAGRVEGDLLVPAVSGPPRRG
jgi:hexokinase